MWAMVLATSPAKGAPGDPSLSPSLCPGEPEQAFGTYLCDWLAHVSTRVRAKTYQGYEGVIRLYALPSLGHVPLSQLHPLLIQRLYATLLCREPPLSAGTVLNLHLVLHQALGQAVRWGLVVANPVSGAQPPRPRRPEPTAVGVELASSILAAAKGTPLELPSAVALCTGMRRGEILGLFWSDIDSDLTLAHVRRTLSHSSQGGLRFEEPKTRRSRRAVALPSFLRPYLLRQQDDQRRRRAALRDRWNETDLVIDSGDGPR